MIESFDNLCMDPKVKTEVGNYVVTAVKKSAFLNIEDLIQSGQPLAKRPLDGVYELSPAESEEIQVESLTKT